MLNIIVTVNLRLGRERVSVMAIAARDTSPDCVIGLDLGADDCPVWPFNLDELAARVRTLLPRYRQTEPLTTMSPPNIFR